MTYKLAGEPIIMKTWIFVCFMVLVGHLKADSAEVTTTLVTSKMHEIMRAHACYKKMSPLLAKRALANFIAILDPSKTYFLQPEIAKWQNPEDALSQQIASAFESCRFPAFEEIMTVMKKCIDRRNILEERISNDTLPKEVHAKEFKKLEWCSSEEELYQRLLRMHALQVRSMEKVDNEFQKIALHRIHKMRRKNEENLLSNNAKERQARFCTDLLKAFASSLDAHTTYFTPAEAMQFLISVQQRLIGIGVKLHDEIDGFSIQKIVEGSPAEACGQLALKDKIIAIDREPVIGLDGSEVVERIRGPEGSEVILTVLREIVQEDIKYTERREVRVKRSQVIMKEARVESGVEAFGDGVICNLKLHSFYQDADSSSAGDLQKAFSEIAASKNVKGVILDLRFNSGGLLEQAVDVVGLFIKKGVVVSIKNENGEVKHYRDLEAKRIWDGPLIVLVNRLSASAAEIVAQALQDYGRAIVVGDDHTFGKGSLQIFTLTTQGTDVDPQGEYKVTQGCYYTVSGKTPQLVGVRSDIVIPGLFTFEEIGESFTKYPLENDTIAANFVDALIDIPFYQREHIRRLYNQEAQKVHTDLKGYIDRLKANSSQRIAADKSYQSFLESLRDPDVLPESLIASCDFQQQEAYNVMRDLLWFQRAA